VLCKARAASAGADAAKLQQTTPVLASKTHSDVRRMMARQLGYHWFPYTWIKEMTEMNWDTIKGQWKEIRGQVKEQWGKLTDDDLDRVEGKRDQLVGAVQKRYGIARDEAERQVKEFETACKC
jgi:uncharacterized protein YjbJ (UPF0337 family)